MKSKNFVLLALFAFSGLLVINISSCKHDLIYDLPVIPPIDTTNPPIDTFRCDTCAAGVISFKEDVLPILQSNCAKSGCHDAITHREGINTTTYEKLMSTTDLQSNKLGSDFWKSITDGSMPPYPDPDLTAQQKAIIQAWIQQGMKNTTCTHQCACDSSSATFAAVINPAIQTFCLGCHSNTDAQGGVNLSGYGNVLTYVNNGQLMKSIKHESGVVPMPYNSQKLSDCTIAKFQFWVNAGAPNN